MTRGGWCGLKCRRQKTSDTSSTATATLVLRATADSIQPRKMTSSTLAWNMKLTSSRPMCTRLTGERQACPKPAACMPPAIQIATTTSATVPNPTASPRRKVLSGAGPVSPILASERPSTKCTQASTAASVGAKPIQISAYKPARPIGSPLGVDHCCDCIHPSSAITGTALNRIIRIGVSQTQGSQPRAGSGEYRATGVMRGSRWT